MERPFPLFLRIPRAPPCHADSFTQLKQPQQMFVFPQECFQQEQLGAGSELHGQEVLLPESRGTDP